jgi:lysophospholipase L1-like esterase
MTGEKYPMKSKLWPRVSLVLNVILVLAIAAACVWKFTDVRNLLGSGGGYSENQWYEPYVYQARNLSSGDGADVVMAGDSLTMYGLWDEFFDGVEVANRGIGSDIAEGLLNRVDTIVSERPRKVFLMIGTNDVSRGHTTGDTVGYVRQTLEELHAQLPDAEIYLQSVLPRTSKYVGQVEELNSEYDALCEDLGYVEWVDLYQLYCEADGTPKAELFAADGYHMSGKGYELWISQIRDLVEE